MPWFKVDDQLPMNPKVIGLPLEALGLWTICGAWSAAQLTDGFVPDRVVSAMLGSHLSATLSTTLSGTLSSAAKQDAKRPLDDPVQSLLDAGLWMQVEGGYQYHDWGEFQPTKAAVEAPRKRMADIGRRGGKARTTRGDKQDAKQSAKRPAKQDGKRTAKQNANSAAKPRTRTHIEDSTVVESGQLALVTGRTAPAVAGASQHGTRLPDDWSPARTDTNLAAEAGRDAAWLTDQLDRFRDYWAGVPGQRGRKRDWDATWRNWIRRSADTSGSARPGAGLTDDQWARALKRAQARDAQETA